MQVFGEHNKNQSYFFKEGLRISSEEKRSQDNDFFIF